MNGTNGSDLTLMALLERMDGLQKAAAEEEGSEGKDSGEKKMPPWLKKDDADSDDKGEKSDKEDKGDESGDSKSEKTEDKKEEGQVKEAADAGAALARQIMEKIASDNAVATTASAGQALAEALLNKQAGVGDVVTQDGTTPEAVPNKSQRDQAAMVAERETGVQLMPTSDGNRNTGGVNEIFDALIANVEAKGAASVDQVHDTGIAKDEGNIVDQSVPNQVKTAYLMDLVQEHGVDFDQAIEMTKQAAAQYEDEMEKIAAVNTLVDEGVSFEDAVALVKQAEQDLALEAEQAAQEEANLIKAAAVEYIVGQGFDFDEALAMLKEAGIGDTVTANGITSEAVPNKSQRDIAAQVAEHDDSIQLMPTSDGNRLTGTVNQIFDEMIARVEAKGAAGVDQFHDQGIAKDEGNIVDQSVPNQVKTAALQRLAAAGVDFDEAAEIVKEASFAAQVKGLAAGAKSSARSLGAKVSQHGRDAMDNVRAIRNPGKLSSMDPSKVRKDAMGKLARNPVVQAGAVGATAAGVGAYAGLREKKAQAVTMLVQNGIDFDTAVQAVSEQSLKMYGE